MRSVGSGLSVSRVELAGNVLLREERYDIGV